MLRWWRELKADYAVWRLGRDYKQAYSDHDFQHVRYRSPYSGTIDGPYDDEADLEPDDDWQV